MRFDPATTFRSSARMTDSNMVPELKSPETLIALIASQRDRQAYAALFMRFAPKVKAFVMGQGLTAQEAEDLAQDALLNVWRKAEMFDPSKATAATWIYSIARNLRIDLARKAKRVKALPEDLWLSENDKPADDMMADAQSAKSIGHLLNTLPEEQKTILRLSFYEDMSHGDIAKTLSIPLGTVKSRMRLAMTRMRAGIGAREDGGAI
jgi:RNA polymerase sigma-70 factor (ECF subfamily)